jgi:hypothetical protein
LAFFFLGEDYALTMTRKMGVASCSAIFSQTHLVTLDLSEEAFPAG